MSKLIERMAAAVVRDAGGQVIGRTRLQKIGYLLELTGLGEGFVFEYRHYGPFSEELARGIELAHIFDYVEEREQRTDWGGFYSIYSASPAVGEASNDDRAAFARAASNISAVALELAATAAYLSAEEGVDDPWEETRRRKPQKAADGRLEKAREAYRTLQALKTPRPLPSIV